MLRSEKRKIDATKNTSHISSYFSGDITTGYSSHEANGSEIVDKQSELPSSSQEGNNHDLEKVSADILEGKLDDPIEDITKKLTDFNLENDFPTDRGLISGDITDANLKGTIIDHGPCRPKYIKCFITKDGTKNVFSEYYCKVVDNVCIPRLWLCYSPFKKPYCEVCWLFSDRINRNRAWIDSVSGTNTTWQTKSPVMKSLKHIYAASVYRQRKSGNTVDKNAEILTKNNISFWTKVLQRLLSIILTMCSLNLALRGHRERSHNGVCEGGNFLAIVALMAQYDEVLAAVFSFPSRAVKYLSHGIQEELISLIGSAVSLSLVSKINKYPFWSIILETTSDIT